MDWSVDILRPDLSLDTVEDLVPHELWRRGIRALLFDLDNTLVGGFEHVPDPTLAQAVGSLRAAGFALMVLSNSPARRVDPIASRLGMPAIGNARKPLPQGFSRALTLLGRTPAETAMVGDTLWTDIVGANLIGITSVLIRPLTDQEHLLSRLLRIPEYWLAGGKWQRQPLRRLHTG